MIKLRELRRKYAPHLTVGAAARYAMLPGFIPRLNRIAASVQHLLFTFVSMLGQAGLIDKNHPCLRVENIGRYPFSHILLLAWSNVRFEKKALPQALFFFAICLTMVLVAAILLFFVLQVFAQVGSAHAQYFYFQTPRPGDIGLNYEKDKDWIFVFLERIFGNTGLFDFWTSNSEGATNQWFTTIFKGMMRAYSSALFGLALFMILYLLVVTLAEAAKTGKPFGKQFDSIWAPIRMALSLFLLVPLTGYYNPAQLLVFQVSEWGSNLASNVWLRGIHSMVQEDQKEKDDTKKKDSAGFINASSTDPGYRFVRDVFLIHLCVKGYNLFECSANASHDAIEVLISSDKTYMTYHFGVKTAKNFCGSIRFPVPFNVPEGAPGNDNNGPKDANAFWPNRVIRGYSDAVTNIITSSYSMSQVADKMVAAFNADSGADFSDIGNPAMIKQWIDEYRATGLGVRDGTYYAAYAAEEAAFNRWIVRSLENDARYGWATAGVFYLRMTAAMAMASKVIEQAPVVNVMPTNMTRQFATPLYPNISNEGGRNICRRNNDEEEYCSPKSASQKLYNLLGKGAEWFSMAPIDSSEIYSDLGTTKFQEALANPQQREVQQEMTERSLFSSVSSWMYDMAKLTSSGLHPLGAVINWGMTFMSISQMAFMVSIAASALASAVKILTGGIWNIGTPLSDIAQTIGMLFLFPGFVLTFIVPLIPAFYFMFAVVEWIISIVEAVIAMPLWALSFITLKGDLLGNGMNGVKSLFEIVLRPLIIIMSLVVAVLVFTAGITFINEAYAMYLGAYDAATSKTLGTVTSVVGGLSAGLIYMFLVYSYATSCFKLVDEIPNNVMNAQEDGWLALPPAFSTMIKAGQTDVRKFIIEGGAVKIMFSKFTGMLPSVGKGAGQLFGRIGNLFKKKEK